MAQRMALTLAKWSNLARQNASMCRIYSKDGPSASICFFKIIIIISYRVKSAPVPACHSWPSSLCCCFLRWHLMARARHLLPWLSCSSAASTAGASSLSLSLNQFKMLLCPSQSSCACFGRRTSPLPDRRASVLSPLSTLVHLQRSPNG